MDDIQVLRPIFLEAARLASVDVMTIYETDFAVDSKSDESPVTAADLAAEHAILTHLTENNVLIPIVSEESVAAGVIPEIDDNYILVDPLDGTREFVNRNGEFTVNIALIVQGQPILGVVFVPALKEAFWGDIQAGAFSAPLLESSDAIMAAGKSIRVTGADSSSGWRAVASRSHLSAETEALLAQNPISETVNYGSSLKLCRLAEGKADIYPRLAPTNQWDIAAGDAVLRAAGGMSITLDKSPFVYKVPRPLRASGFLNSWFVAHGGIDVSKLTV